MQVFECVDIYPLTANGYTRLNNRDPSNMQIRGEASYDTDLGTPGPWLLLKFKGSGSVLWVHEFSDEDFTVVRNNKTLNVK